MKAAVTLTITLVNDGEVKTYHGQHTQEVKMPTIDPLRALMLNGTEARVTASMDMKDNNYGKGYGAHVSVALTCAQDEEAVSDALAAAAAVAEENLPDVFEKARTLFEEWVSG